MSGRLQFGLKQYLLLGLAVAGGLGLNAYREYRDTGTLDGMWFGTAAFTIASAFTIFYLVARRMNRPLDKE